MTYQTLYRKYRSTDLNELVGQTHIIQTITNAIEYDRLAHAYIFSGPRGTGKTSTARILAKMINKTVDDISVCPICEKIAMGSCVDVIEIDAASHTGVDYMRQLIDQVQFLPVEAAYKVFIIDEVHMLSTGAFNALLKTLEEPPKQVVFILATTELHKIPATIQSRSQTLHFRLLDSQLINNHMAHVCQQEGYAIESDALDKLTAMANGGMRDALSLLDQLMSVAQDKSISLSDINQILGTVDDDAIKLFLKSCFSNDLLATQQLKKFLDQGIDIFQFYDDLIQWLHHRLLIEGQHGFDVDDLVVSKWLSWFCEQVAELKNANSPTLVAQVNLNTQLLVSKSPQVASAPVVDQPIPQKPQPVAPAPVIQAEPQPEVASQPPKQAVNVDLPVPSQRTPIPEASSSASVGASSSLKKDDAATNVLHKMANQFPVLTPVIKDATLMVRGETLCLVLEETYQFFEKKLSEDKFKLAFLDAYNQALSTSLTQWFVTSDVNKIHALGTSTSSNTDSDFGNESPNSDAQVAASQSKTVNQIIEMFEGQILQ